MGEPGGLPSVGLHRVGHGWSDLAATDYLSVQFSCSVVSNPLPLQGLWHARLLYHQLPGLAQTHVHQVGDVIQPSYTLSSPSPPAFNLSQHQVLFQ